MDLKSIGQYALVGSNPAVVDYYPSLHGSVVEHTPSKRKVQSSNLCEGLYIYALACGSCFLSNILSESNSHRSAEEARQAHNLEVLGSKPSDAYALV